jgi:hypothetical protein
LATISDAIDSAVSSGVASLGALRLTLYEIAER